MSTFSLISVPKLHEVPTRKIIVDSRLERVAEQAKEATTIRDQLCILGNTVDAGIRRRTASTGEKIKYLGEVQQASAKYWTIVGSTIAALIGVNAVMGGWKFWRWLKQRRKKDPDAVRVNEARGVKSFDRRFHVRDWKVTELKMSED